MVYLSGVKQAKLSRAEEWADKLRTKGVGGGWQGGEDGEMAKKDRRKR